jgi:DNA polymerase-3 subunit alpha
MINLHNHTIFSAKNSIIKINDLVSKIKQYNQQSVAIVDDNGLYGVMKFVKACNNEGIKYIIGCNINFTDDCNIHDSNAWPIVLIVKNDIGYQNLCKLITRSYEDDCFFRKPKIDFSLLKQYNEGLICLSGDVNGPIFKSLLEDKIDYAKWLIKEFQSIFNDDFYLEINPYSDNNYINVLNDAITLLNDNNIIITNNTRFLTSEEYEYYDLIYCMNNSLLFKDNHREKASIDEYLKSESEIIKHFQQYLDLEKINLYLSNTHAIDNKIDFKFNNKIHFPKAKIPDDFKTKYINDSEQKLTERYFKNLINVSWKQFKTQLSEDKIEEYKTRLFYEFDVISKSGFIDYFLVVRDIILFAKNNNIPVGPARGSVGGSLLAYLIGITEIDPIKYELIFERFLNPDRVSLPDIDVDVSTKDRGLIVNYIESKYGKDNTATVGNIGTLAFKLSIKDTARVLNVPYARSDSYTKLIPFKVDSTDKLLEDYSIKNLVENNSEFKEILHYADKIKGSMKNMTTHAAGIAIAPEPITHFVPLQVIKMKNSNTKKVSTQFEKDAIEDCGLVKIDLLGLTALDTIQYCIKLIKDRHNKDIELLKLDFNDKKIFKFTKNGLNCGIFQLEGHGISNLTSQIEPNCLDDIRDINALYRPAVLAHKYQYVYIDNKFSKTNSSIHPIIDSITKPTYGIILYQEQSMEVAVKMANFSLAEADLLRKAIGKKNTKDIPILKKKFYDGCKKNNIPDDITKEVFDIFEQADYSFNKAHSLAYGILTCRTLWLKTYYTLEFMTAALCAEYEDFKKITQYINECKKFKIKVLQPDINKSDVNFCIEKNNIRYGISSIKEIGLGFAEQIVEIRKKYGDYLSIIDFSKKLEKENILNSNISKINILINCGLFDSLEHNREKVSRIFAQFSKTEKTVSNLNKKNSRSSLFETEDLINLDIQVRDLTLDNKRLIENTFLGISFT